MEVSNLFVCLMGMGVTFVGLIVLIYLIQLMGAILRRFEKPASAVHTAAPVENRGELIAAISAALAEEMGTDVSALRILELRRIS